MTNRLFTVLRYTAIVALVAGLFVVSGCDEDPTGPTLDMKSLIESSAYAQATTGDATKSLDTLVYYIKAYPELAGFMTGTVAHTFFAPSNAAFQSLKATPGFPTNPNALKLINKSIVEGVLRYHFSEGKKMKSELTSGLVLDSKFTDPLAPTAAQKITVNADGTLKASPLAANVAIDLVVADQEATNGVVHIIESVMIAPSTGEVLIPILGQVAGSIILADAFSNLTKVIQYADAGFVEATNTLTFKVTKWLAMPINSATLATANLKGITFFAPPNKAGTADIFTTAKADAVIALGKEGARNFLLNHLVVTTPANATSQPIGQYIVGTPPANDTNGTTKFTTGMTIKPLRGETKRLFVSIVTASATIPTGVLLSNAANAAGANSPPADTFKPILLGDSKALNGYFHVIGGQFD